MGAGGAMVLGVRVGERSIDDGRLQVGISRAPELREGFVWLGLVDEAGHDVVGARSPLLHLGDGAGEVSCELEPPLRNGLYFPVVAISSPDGTVRDHWQLDRPIVFERNGNGTPTGVGAVTSRLDGPRRKPRRWDGDQSLA